MSFPKAKLKRFNELDGCGPPVGSYDPKPNDGTPTALFLRSDRFRNGAESLESSISSVELSAKKSTCFKKPYFPKLHGHNLMQTEYTKVQECEKEIRRLLKERSDLLKQLSLKEEEMKKLEGKLQTVMRERSHFQANMATFEKEVKELRHANDILKMKVNTLEGASKAKDIRVDLANMRAAVIEKEHVIVDLKQELTSVKQEHEKCSHELNDKDSDIKRINDEMVFAVKNLEEELECSKNQIFDLEAQKNNLVDSNDEISSQVCHLENKIANYEITIKELTRQKELLSANLKEYGQDLEIKKQQMNQTVEELRNENLDLINRIEVQTNRRQSQEKFLSTELDNAYQKLGVTEDCSRALQEYKDVLVGRVTVLKECVNELEKQQSLDMQTIKDLKVELMIVTTRLAEKEHALLDADTNKISLNETIRELKSTHDQLQSMTEKCIFLEEELNYCEADHKERMDKLEVEVLVTKLSYEASEQELGELRRQLPEIQSSLEREQHACKQLQTEIKQQKSNYCKTVGELNDQIIKVGNECNAKVEEIARLELAIDTHSSQINVLTKKLELEMGEKNKLVNLNLMQLLQCSKLEEQFEEAQQEKMELETALQSSNSLLESLRDTTCAEKRTMEDEMAKLRDENRNMDFEISQFLSKESVLEAQVNTYMESVSMMQQDVNKMQEKNVELASVMAIKEAEVKELTNTINDYKDKFSKTEIEKNTLEEFNENLKKQLEDLEIKRADHAKLYQETKEDVKEKSELVDTLSAECETIQIMFSELYEEKNNLEMEFRNLSRQLFNATEALTSEKDECIALKSKLNKKIREVKTLNEKLQEAEEKGRNLQNNMEAMEEREIFLECMCQSFENQIDDSHRNLASVQHEMGVQLSTLSDQLEHVLKEKHGTESLFLESKNVEKLLKEELTHTMQKMHDLASLLESSKSEVADLQAEVDLLNSSFVEQQKTLVELNVNILTSQTQVESLTKDIGNREEKINETEFINEQLEKDLQDALEYRNLSNGHHEELTRTTEKLHKLKLHLASTEYQISMLQSEVDALRSCVVEKEQLVLKQSSDYDSLNNAMTALIDEFKNKDETVDYIRDECRILQESLELRYGEIAELKTVIETNHQLISETHDNSIIEDLRSTTAELDSLYETCQDQQLLIKKMDSEKEELGNRIKQLETEVETQSAQTQWLADKEKKLLRELDFVEEDAKLKQQEYIRVLRETQKQYAQLESDRYKQLKETEGRQNEEMLQALTNEYESRIQLLSQHIDQLKKESLSWKSQFEDLQAKVAPFQEQLDAFEVERNMMMSKTNETLSDFQKLSQQYAALLGHQNHKQKIQHVCKLKEEILSLKEEKTKLASDNMKLRKQLQRRDGGSIPSSARKFDPSKAFQHPNKENDSSLREFPNNLRQF